ncbi:hypothetical protein AB833_17720 [Chromatiales bacterium (ex Bugula neritina AB1)]|nr:hypothetical protein AB833_17720 [Chromatiales bacterium (ex Bugula neritina AB1)]
MANAQNALLPLEATEISFRVKGKQLLSPSNLCISDNGITVILGHNGAGKSLLLRLLHGLLEPDTGTIHWNRKNSSELSVRLKQSMVFQKPVLLRRCVAANIDYVLNLRKRPSVEYRNELLQSAGLADKSAQYARSLSGGEQQRLAIARALATGPSVLFLDEPSASLDPEATGQIEQQVRHANHHGIKVIMVTHDLSQARRLSDDIVFMDHGTIAEHTAAAQFFHAPTSLAGATYLASYLNTLNSEQQPS